MEPSARMTPTGITVEELLAHAPWLRRLAGTLVAGSAAADDLVQETWLQALDRPPRAPGALRPWLARVARNLASNLRRGEARRAAHEAGVAPAGTELDPGRIAEELEAQRVLAEAVLRLEEPLRTTVVLRHFRGLDSAAIGRLQGVPSGTVRWRLKHALELLRVDLDRRFGERRTWLAFLAPLTVPHASPIDLAPGDLAPWKGVTLMSATTKIAITAAGVLVTLAGFWILGASDETPAAVAETRAGERVTLDTAPAEPAVHPALPGAPSGERETLAVEPASTAGPAEHECCIVGRVLDPEGREISGARVVAQPARLDTMSLRTRTRPEEPALETTSAADGSYSLQVPGRRPFVLTAAHGDLAPASSPLSFAGERRDLVLAPGSTLAVRATDEAGAPCAEARIRVVFDTPDAAGELWTGEAVADAAGRAELRGLPAGKGEVEGRRALLRGVRAITVDGRAAATCELVLYGTGRIEGRVFERGTGRPIAGARVGAMFHGVQEVVTDASGRYALEGITLSEGLWVLGARAQGYASRFELLSCFRGEEQRRMDFALDPAVRVAGRVLDAERRAITGARVVFLGIVPVEPYTAETDRSETVTDARGAFTVEDLHPDVAYRVLALAPGRATGLFACGPFAVGAVGAAGAEPADLGELVLDAAGSIAGEAAGVPGAPGPWDVELHWDDPASTGAQLSHVETTRADSRGRFAFEGLRAGRYRLSLVDPDAQRSAPVAEELVELAPGERRSAVALRPDGRAISGSVVAPDGRRLTCKVRLFATPRPDQELRAAYTDGEGRFRLSVHEAGPFRLIVEERTLMFETRVLEPVEAGTSDLVVELAEFHSDHTIRGIVTVEGVPAPDDLFVSFWDSATGERLARVAFLDLDGVFEMKNLRDAPYDVGVLDFDNRYEPVRVAGVRPDGDDLELKLVPKR